MSSVWCPYCQLWTYFTICSKVFIVDLELADAQITHYLPTFIKKTCVCVHPMKQLKMQNLCLVVNLARKITKKQWHSERVSCWLHSRCFLVIILIIPDYHILGKKHITFANSQWSFTSLIFIQSSELRPILNSTPCRINKFINNKSSGLGASLSWNKFSTTPGDLVTWSSKFY